MPRKTAWLSLRPSLQMYFKIGGQENQPCEMAKVLINRLVVNIYMWIYSTLTGRSTPKPHSCSLTSLSTIYHQVVACIATVGGCLSKGCSSSVANLAISWVIQSPTVHNCEKVKLYVHLVLCQGRLHGCH